MQPAGVPTQDLIAQARSGLRTSLRGAVHDAIRGNQRVILPACRCAVATRFLA